MKNYQNFMKYYLMKNYIIMVKKKRIIEYNETKKKNLIFWKEIFLEIFFLGVSRLALKIKEYSNEDSRFAEQEIQDWIYLKEIAAANQRQSQK